MSELILAIGLVFILEGLAYGLFPGPIKRMMHSVMDQSDQNLRTLGIVVAGVGVAIIWAFK